MVIGSLGSSAVVCTVEVAVVSAGLSVVVGDNWVVVISNEVISVSFVVVVITVEDNEVIVIGRVVVSVSFIVIAVVVPGIVVVASSATEVSMAVVVPLTQFVEDVSCFAPVHELFIASCEHSGVHSQGVPAG